LTRADLAAANGGRLPVGLGSVGRTGSDVAMPAIYTDTTTPTVTIDTATGTVLALDLRLVRTVQVTAPSGVTVSGGTISQASVSMTPAEVAVAASGLRTAQQQRADAELLGRVLPALLGAFAIALLAFGLPRLIGRRERNRDVARAAPAIPAPPPPPAPAPHLTSAGPSPPGS